MDNWVSWHAGCSSRAPLPCGCDSITHAAQGGARSKDINATTPLLVRRTRAGLWILLLALVLFALAELTFASPMAQQGGTGYEQFEQFRQLVGGNKGILKVTKIEDGKVVPQLEAIKIEPKPVSDDAFKPPAGYTEVKMGDMIRQSQNAMKQMQEKMKENQKTQ